MDRYRAAALATQHHLEKHPVVVLIYKREVICWLVAAPGPPQGQGRGRVVVHDRHGNDGDLNRDDTGRRTQYQLKRFVGLVNIVFVDVDLDDLRSLARFKSKSPPLSFVIPALLGRTTPGVVFQGNILGRRALEPYGNWELVRPFAHARGAGKVE